MDGANGSTTFTDVTGKIITPTGNVQISTAQSKFSGASSLFSDGSGYLSAPVSTDMQFGIGDLTWECYARPSTVTPGTLISVLGNAQGSQAGNSGLFMIVHNSKFQFRHWVNGNSNAICSQTIAINTWYHVAATKVGTVIKIFVDGIEGTAGSTTLANQDNQFRIGATINNGGFAANFQGHIDEVRITKGFARYTANFTPPTAAFPDN